MISKYASLAHQTQFIIKSPKDVKSMLLHAQVDKFLIKTMECIRCGEGSSYNNLNRNCELDSPPTPTPKPIPTPPTPMCYHGKIYSKDIKQC